MRRDLDERRANRPPRKKKATGRPKKGSAIDPAVMRIGADGKLQQATDPSKRLTDARHEIFAVAYVHNGCIAKHAAEKAGYERPQTEGSKLRRRADIAARIDFLMTDIGLTRNLVKSKLSRDILGNIADFQDFLDQKKTLVELRAEGIDTSVIKKVKIMTKNGFETREVEMYDSAAATIHLAKILGMVADTNVNVRVSGFVEVLKSASTDELARLAAALSTPSAN